MTPSAFAVEAAADVSAAIRPLRGSSPSSNGGVRSGSAPASWSSDSVSSGFSINAIHARLPEYGRRNQGSVFFAVARARRQKPSETVAHK